MEDTYDVENPPEESAIEQQTRMDLPKPGDVIGCDFRPEEPAEGSADIADSAPHAAPQPPPANFKVLDAHILCVALVWVLAWLSRPVFVRQNHCRLCRDVCSSN